MDNITHSLFGYGAAAAVLALIPRRRGSAVEPDFASVAIGVSVAANNFPDLDIFFPVSFSTTETGRQLGYLLNHRGYTHTLIAAIPQAILLCAIFLLVRNYRGRPKFGRGQWATLFFLALLGPAIHIGLDSLNTYGVHPFWPWNNRWFYGDSLFIVEPWLWLALTPTFFFYTARRYLRVTFAALFATALLACFFSGYVPIPVAAFTLGLGALSFGLAKRFRGLASGLALTLTFLSTFALTSAWVKNRVREVNRTASPGLNFTDVVISPLPANPLCWSFMAVAETVGDADARIVRKGMISTWPAFLDVNRCPQGRRGGEGYAPLTPVALAAPAGFLWLGEYRASHRQLVGLARENCEVAGFLKFARLPFVASVDGKDFVGDLRFDWKQGGFARFPVSRQVTCRKDAAPWAAPSPY